MNIPFLPEILEKLVPKRLFARLNIASKMLLGYMSLVVLTVIVVVYALISLQRINALNRSIVKVDIIIQESSDKMLDALLGQDMYEKRYLILKSRDMRDLFAKRGKEFDAWLTTVKDLSNTAALPTKSIEDLHLKYTDLFSREIQLVRSNKVDQAYAVSNQEMKNIFDKLVETLKAMSSAAKESQDMKMKQITTIGSRAFLTTAVLCLISIIAGALAGLVVTHHISSSIHKLKEATERISEGNFDYDPRITTEDEIGSLSNAFLAMGKRLRKLEEMYLDASPLTRLPGGIAIENVLKKRIDSNQPIAFCVLDLDNFKAFNDRYGYANGSEVIKETAKIIESVVKSTGTSDDFIGHVGGDDFVVITTPEYMRTISTEIISQFDKRIPDFYDREERARGYILGKTRQGIEMEFPIMSISIAIVTNEHRKLTNPLEASEVAAELKDYAKSIPKSVFVVDKRRNA
ncbi:MAG: diguanylate cyclase [Nitrospirae bacterium]|nr:diguanylate cyclase [Nitrospirota bacterium]